MTIFVILVGLLMLCVGAVIVVSPEFIRSTLPKFIQVKWLTVAAIARVIFGILFIIAAPGTKLPGFIYVVGVLMMLAGIGIPILGLKRIERFASWWLQKPDIFLRLCSLAVVAFGALLVWCGL